MLENHSRASIVVVVGVSTAVRLSLDGIAVIRGVDTIALIVCCTVRAGFLWFGIAGDNDLEAIRSVAAAVIDGNRIHDLLIPETASQAGCTSLYCDQRTRCPPLAATGFNR